MPNHESNVVIEAPVLSDVEAIATLFREDMTTLRVDVTQDSMERLARSIIEDLESDASDCVCWVARLSNGGKAVGVMLANYNWSLKFAGRALWIEELYVTPSARRNGIGRLLVERVLDFSENNGICGVDLEAYQGNTPASILYRSLGFHRLGRERFYYRVGTEDRF